MGGSIYEKSKFSYGGARGIIYKVTMTGLKSFNRLQTFVILSAASVLGVLFVLVYRLGIVYKYNLRLSVIPASMLDMYSLVPHNVSLLFMLCLMLLVFFFFAASMTYVAYIVCKKSTTMYGACTVNILWFAFLYVGMAVLTVKK